jgi:hypothetical protein
VLVAFKVCEREDTFADSSIVSIDSRVMPKKSRRHPELRREKRLIPL